jgi:Tat protein secretion system quality control protein TatD with DNase activity
MIDVHAHLASDAYADIGGVLARARAAGVRKIVMSITDPREYPSARSIVDRHPGYVFLTVGFDPAAPIRGYSTNLFRWHHLPRL